MRRYALRKIVVALLAAICCSRLAAQSAPPVQSNVPQAAAVQDRHPRSAYGRLPFFFEANRGQADERVKFLSHGLDYTVFLRPTEALFALRHPRARKESAEVEGIGIKLLGASPRSQILGSDELPGNVSYFIGNDRSRWITGVSTYSKVRYQQIYPGIDLVFYGNEQQLESDFVVAPGANPAQIRLHFKGVQGLGVSPEGNLVLKTLVSELRLLKPNIYQDVDGTRREVNGHYVLRGARTVSFSVGTYDHAVPLVIDPVLVYSTALNGANFTVGNGGGHGIAVDTVGNAYVTGYTDRSNFLPTPGAFTTTTGLLFVSKLNPTGSGVDYTAVFGGTDSDVAMAVAVDAQGEAIITGFTSSADFPTTNALQATLPAGTHAFLTKLNAAGSGLLYSTLLGGSGATGAGNATDVGNAVTTDAGGALYVTGYTNSADFPTKNAVQPACPDLQLSGYCNVQGFVTKLDPTQSGTASLVYSTYLGGNFPTFGQAIVVDASGNAYITGNTNATDFPVTQGAYQTKLVGGTDAFVSVLNATGNSFVYSTYLGYGFGWGIAVDGQGNAYVTGATNAFGGPFPVTAGAFQTSLGGSITSNHAFVTKLNPSGTGLVYSTFLGGSGRENDNTGNIAIDATGNAYISGFTASSDFPTTANAIQATFGGLPSDAFVTELNASGSGLIYSTYLGGVAGDQAYGLALDPVANVYVMGTTGSANFPTTAGAFEPTVNTSTGSIFVARIGAPLTNTTAGASANPSVFGQQVSFTATVSPTAPSNLTPSGTVTFSDGATTLGTATIISGTAIFNTASLSVGSHTITAAYGGDSNFAASTSTSLAQLVNQAGTATTVASSPSPAILGQSVVLTASVGAVAPGAGVPTGTVTFLDGSTVLGAGTLNGAGSATFSTSSLSTGNHSLTASYAGDTSFTASTSAPMTLTVQGSAPATHLVVAAPASAMAGTLFSVTVTALDASNNQVTVYTGTVRFASTDSQAVLPSIYTFTVSDQGTHVFSVTLNTAGSQTITATDTANSAITGPSASIIVTSAVPPLVQIIDNETITVSDTESFPDVFAGEAVHVTDSVFVTPLIAVTAPVAEFSAGGLGFGGQSGTQTLAVSDIGQAPLKLASATISGGAQFNVAQISCSNGTTSLSPQVPVGGVCTFTINYATSGTPANDNATLVFADNAALSNLPSMPSGANYTQSLPLTGGGTNIGPPPPPPATVSVTDNEMVHVTDAESFPDVFDGETVHVQDQVTLATLQAITVTPANSTIANGAAELFTATGTFSDGRSQDLSALVTWSSSNLAVATMNGNRATAVGLGLTAIAATLGNAKGSTNLTVRVPFLRISATFSSITKAVNGGYSVAVSVTNTGEITANSVTLVLGILGAATTGASTPVTGLTPGATATLTLAFTNSAGASGSTQPLFVLGLATGTGPNGVPAPPAIWLIGPRQVKLP